MQRATSDEIILNTRDVDSKPLAGSRPSGSSGQPSGSKQPKGLHAKVRSKPADNVRKFPAKVEAPSTDDIVRQLLADGVPLEKIRIPGHGLAALIRIADDFDTPLDELKDYTFGVTRIW